MTTEEQFSDWVQKEKETEILAYLRQADTKERKNLVSTIKKLSKYYGEWITTNNSSYKSRGSQKQQNILTLAAFVCYNRAEFEKHIYASWILEPALLNKIKPWYMPDWFGDFVNKLGEAQFFSSWVNYDNLMAMAEEGYVQPSRRLICLTLPQYIFEQQKNVDRWHSVYKPEKLLQRSITLQEHVWYLLEEESNIHYSDRYLNFENDVAKEKVGWIEALVHFAKEGKLDRHRLLKESLLAANRKFNKILSSWFTELFAALQPIDEELMGLQPELFSLLNSPHSKPVNESLSYLKKITGHSNFDTASLIDALPAVLSSKTKNIVSAGLILLEQVGKKEKNQKSSVVQLASQAFVHTDETLQTRAAKLIARMAEKNDSQLTETLTLYHDSLLQNAKTILSNWMQEPIGVQNENNDTISITNETQPLQPIAAIDTIDELVFLASQAFDNNASWHIDVLPAALIKLQPQLKGNVLPQLQPALQRALKLMRSGLRSTQGQCDHLLAVFFIDVCVQLVRQHGTDAATLNKVFDDHDQRQQGNVVAKWMNIAIDSSYTSTWENYTKDPVYEPYKQLLQEALHKFCAGDTTPLLSTPTNEPAWINAAVLINRLHLYQQAGRQPHAIDIQIAMGRCYLKDTDKAIALTNEKLNGEWKQLMLFLLTTHAEPEEPYNQPGAWMMASICKWPKKVYTVFDKFGYYGNGFEKYTGQYKWAPVREEYETSKYRYEKDKLITEKVMATRMQLKIYFEATSPNAAQRPTAAPTLLQRLGLHKQKKEGPPPQPLLFDYLKFNNNFFSHEHNDVSRILLMAPNNVEVYLPLLIKHCMQHPENIGEVDKKMLIAALQVLHELWDSQQEMAHLFLATAMIMADKTVAATAAGIWLQYAPAGKVDVALIGNIAGQNISIGYAPLKRFTDLVMHSMFKVSARHNQLLLESITALLIQLPNTPLTNLKKLLEIYAELQSITQSRPQSDALLQRFEIWKANAGLNKVLMGIIP